MLPFGGAAAPKLADNRDPSYRLHKQSGQAVVTLNGRDVLIGPHGTAASRAEYRRRIAEWVSGGRQAPAASADLSVAELIAAYKNHVEVLPADLFTRSRKDSHSRFDLGAFGLARMLSGQGSERSARLSALIAAPPRHAPWRCETSPVVSAPPPPTGGMMGP